jgi:uroporphyrin-III C-methyltransferase
MRVLLEDHPEISLVCVADSSIREGTRRRSFVSANQIFDVCQNARIPVNITDMPELCSFTFPTSHRFTDPENGNMTPLQISVTTNGKGCRLGGRIKRDIVSKLPKGTGVAVEKIGRLRELSQSIGVPATSSTEFPASSFLEAANSSSPNEPVDYPLGSLDPFTKVQRRMRWVAQMSEFWQIGRLAALSGEEMENLLKEGQHLPETPHGPSPSSGCDQQAESSQQSAKMHHPASHHGLNLIKPTPNVKGKIYLLGSGIGHPLLLTVAAHDLLSRRATVVLSDKLVPSAILELIPSNVRVVIARKFPGNADAAQNELMELGVEAAGRGETVVRVSTRLGKYLLN